MEKGRFFIKIILYKRISTLKVKHQLNHKFINPILLPAININLIIRQNISL